MTKSYAEIKAAIAKLENQAAELRASEVTKVVAQIKETIATYGLTVEHLFGRGAKALKAAVGKVRSGGKAPRKGAGIPKFRDPKTGKTWTGFGKPPAWIASARSRDKFLIDQSGVVAESAAAETAAPVAKKARVKGSAAAAKRNGSVRRMSKADAAASEAKAEQPVSRKTAAKKAPARKNAAASKVNAARKSAPKAAKSTASRKARGPRASAKPAQAALATADAGAPESSAAQS